MFKNRNFSVLNIILAIIAVLILAYFVIILPVYVFGWWGLLPAPFGATLLILDFIVSHDVESESETNV